MGLPGISYDNSDRKNRHSNLWAEVTSASLDYLTKASLYHSNSDEGDAIEDETDNEDEPDNEDEADNEDEENSGGARKAGASSPGPDAPVEVVTKVKLSDWFVKRSK